VKWVKHGIVWRPDGRMAWAASHATCPTHITLPDGALRVFVQCRDAANVGRVAWVDLDPEDPRRVIRQCREPALDIGRAGAFDDNGVFPTCVLPRPDGRLFLYYVGFELCRHIRYRLLTGLAISRDGGHSFVRASDVPILERSTSEPHIRGGPWVIDEGSELRMWYVAGGTWQTIDGKPMPVYDIRHLRSNDGMRWPEQGQVVLPLTQDGEHGFGRPYVTRRGPGWQMHYSVRHRDAPTYRLGLAESDDGLAWRRKDQTLGLEVTPGSWDSDSIEYGAPIAAGGRDWLLYNGNDFGSAGFGIAERVED
jgi:predicted GH43/DUF377 family glycosyl hydrolase